MSKKNKREYTIGVDYGTHCIRAILVDVSDGSEVASSVYHYPSGDSGILRDPNNPLIARQNPQDYIEGFLTAVSNTVYSARRDGIDTGGVRGIGVGATASTPIPVDEAGVPLALNPVYEEQISAHAWLCKDRSSFLEAERITAFAEKSGENYLAKCGGTYSSEWFWSKILHCKKESPVVFKAAFSWVELVDFIPAYITGNLDPGMISRSACAAGHKALYNESWGGLPGKAFLKKLDPDLLAIRDRYAPVVQGSDKIAGLLDADVAMKVGLSAGIPVAVGCIETHAGAVGAGIKPGSLVKILGANSCDLMVHPMKRRLRDIPGLCGIVPDSILPGMYGLEAGQSAVGELFHWFAKYLTPGRFYTTGDSYLALSREAAKIQAGESGLLALDWNNGNRTILADEHLRGLLLGQTLRTTAPEVFRALVEATAFGALTIINRFEEYGVKVNEIINCGVIAENPLMMQIYADVFNRPIKIGRTPHACALGAAVFGAVVGGVYKKIEDAQQNMTGFSPASYKPNKKAVGVYEKLYVLYRQLHDAFGGVALKKHQNSPGTIMKELIAIQNSVRK